MPNSPRRPDRSPSPPVDPAARRRALKAGALGAIAASPALLGACASVSDMRAKVVGGDPGAADTYRRRIGDIEVTTLLDGYFSLEREMLRNVDEDELERILAAGFLAPDAPIPLGISTHLLRVGGRTVLVGAGAGAEMGSTAGRLPAALASLGVAAEDVDDLLLTHLHPDHMGGALSDGAAAFPNAVLHVSEIDAAYWSDPGNAESAPDPLEPAFALAADLLDAYSDRLNRFGGRGDLGNGITSEPLPGHTPGHVGYRLASGDEQLLIWGDMAVIAAVQFTHPSIGVVFDSDVARAAATRKRALDMIATERLLISGTHLPFPAYGHVVADGAAWRWEPEEWQYG